MSAALVNRGIPGTFMDIIHRLHGNSTDMDIINLQSNSHPSKQPVYSFPKAEHNEPIYEPMDWTSSTNLNALNSRGRFFIQLRSRLGCSIFTTLLHGPNKRALEYICSEVNSIADRL